MLSKILVVDDEVLIRKSMQADLAHAGYDVGTAASGLEALTELDQNNYDLIITDLMMDEMGGIELIGKVREKNLGLPIIIITGFSELKSAIEALRLGAADYLRKPYDNEELMLRINSCLEKRDLQKKIRLYEDILPICAYCKKIRDDANKEPGTGDWLSLEQYLHQNTEMELSHGVCEECMKKEVEKFKAVQHNLKG